MIWYIKQLIPLRHISKYKVADKQYVSVWTQWMGHAFKHRKFEIVKEVPASDWDTYKD